MWNGLRVAVVVPAFNEQRLIASMLAALPSWVDRVVVVDDCSEDQTREVVRALENERLVLLTHETNRGVGAAIVTGYRYAQASHDVLVVMAGDNQMSPDDLPSLLAPILRGAAYVKGNRFRHAKYGDMPWHRRLGSRLLSGLTRRLTGLSVDDCQCGFTALAAGTAQILPLEQLWPRYGYPNDLLAMLAAFDADVREVPVKPVYGNEKSGLHPGHLLHIAWLGVSRRKLYRGCAKTRCQDGPGTTPALSASRSFDRLPASTP